VAFGQTGLLSLVACQGGHARGQIQSDPEGIRRKAPGFAAKVIALGARAAGIATPLLEPSTIGATAVVSRLEQIIEELRIAMFLVGASNMGALRDTPLLREVD